MPTSPRRVILASHLIWTAYAHWLPNDPRGSGSTQTRKPDLHELGDIHFGRKQVQPPRTEVRRFHQQAEPLLEHPVIWFDHTLREAIAHAFAQAIATFGYTLYAFCVCSNHAHAVVRTHRDRAEVIWQNLANASRDALRQASLVAQDHPVWSQRPYKVSNTHPRTC